MPKRTDGIAMRCPDGPLDPLRMWHNRTEAWMLEQAGGDFKPEQAERSVRD